MYSLTDVIQQCVYIKCQCLQRENNEGFLEQKPAVKYQEWIKSVYNIVKA